MYVSVILNGCLSMERRPDSRRLLRFHSGWMPAASATRFHLALSSTMNLRKAAPEMPEEEQAARAGAALDDHRLSS
jgi:hypothetical protein